MKSSLQGSPYFDSHRLAARACAISLVAYFWLPQLIISYYCWFLYFGSQSSIQRAVAELTTTVTQLATVVTIVAIVACS